MCHEPTIEDYDIIRCRAVKQRAVAIDDLVIEPIHLSQKTHAWGRYADFAAMSRQRGKIQSDVSGVDQGVLNLFPCQTKFSLGQRLHLLPERIPRQVDVKVPGLDDCGRVHQHYQRDERQAQREKM